MTTKPAEGIYDLLDITSDASPALAHEMYWRKLEPYVQKGSELSDYSETIDALNRALAIVLDERLRASYDAAHPHEVRQHRQDIPRQERSKRRSVILIVGWTTLAAILLFGKVGTLPALAPVSVGLTALLWLRIRGAGPEDEPAFTTLHLRPRANQAQIEIAYRVRAQQILLRIRRDPRVISELDDLDKAYVRAMTVALARNDPEETVRAEAATALGRDRVDATRGPARAERLAKSTTRIWAPALRFMQSALERGGSFALRSAEDIRTVAMQEIATRTSSDKAPEVELPPIDLQHRLSAGLKSGAEHVARAVTPPASLPMDTAVGEAGTTAFLLLESAMGTRRVQLGEKPVSIGTSPSCDLALPEQEGLQSEHALVWQHGPRIVLHAALDATCLVNGDPVTWAMLEDGDMLQVGTYSLRVSATAA